LSAGAGEPAQLRERIAAEQDERRRLAELIHDGPVQHLGAIAQMLDAAAHAVERGDDGAATTILRRALAVTREANGDLREIVGGLEPASLAAGFGAAVRELAERMRARRDVVFDLDVGAGDTLGEAAQIGLYQIVRESLDQAVRRGPPRRIWVTLRGTASGGAELRIADDGSGERRKEVLEGLAERAATLNAEFAAERSSEGGTAVRVTLPPSAAQR
jgi:signal transduction histidine kinase